MSNEERAVHRCEDILTVRLASGIVGMDFSFGDKPSEFCLNDHVAQPLYIIENETFTKKHCQRRNVEGLLFKFYKTKRKTLFLSKFCVSFSESVQRVYFRCTNQKS